MVSDPDAPSRQAPADREWLHWLVTNIPGDQIGKGNTVYEYISSGPGLGSGLHRYIFLVYLQSDVHTFDEPYKTNT